MSDKIISLFRKRLAREKGAVKKDWGGRVAVALAYPNYYRTGMSNLGFQVVYHLLNSKRNIVAERFFLPDDTEMSLYGEAGKGILSLESQSPLHSFDLAAFSLSFENDYPNILKILDMGKLPLLSNEREEHHPLVMAGGVTTFLNPEPMADFFDLFLLGEAEGVLDLFMERYIDARGAGEGRQETLSMLARDVPSVYVPSFYSVEYRGDGTIENREPLERDIPEKIEAARMPPGKPRIATSVIQTPETPFAQRVLIELGRGCGRSCRFCAAGYVYRPPRTYPKEELLATVGEVLNTNDRVGLLSAAITDTPGIENVMELILEKGGNFSVSSLRADSMTENMVGHLKAAGQKTLAIAPEAGSERLRKVINKHLTEDQIMQAAAMIARAGEFNLRLYFMVGLPTETREDVDEILELVKTMKHHIVKESGTRGRIGRIRLSINCFIPKPFTPFQWFPLEQVPILKEKQKWLKKALRKEGGIKVSFDLPKWAYVQSLLSMGDRRVGSILLSAYQSGGDWKQACRFSDVNPDFFVHRPKGLDENLPWDFIDQGLYKEHLIKEYKLALKAKESDTCHVGECDRCGVCTVGASAGK
ncbi:MAG: radical SAM protein [Deltaproteobacteria bacterium]|nr:radical SAM protein [Deltaproteobacteria bacterium]